MYKGRLIIENLSNLTVLNYLDIEKTEHKETDNVITFTSKYIDFPFILAECLKSKDDQGKPTFAFFEETSISFIIMKDNVLSYNRGNHQEKDQVIKRCIELGIDPSDIENIEVR